MVDGQGHSVQLGNVILIGDWVELPCKYFFIVIFAFISASTYG